MGFLRGFYISTSAISTSLTTLVWAHRALRIRKNCLWEWLVLSNLVCPLDRPHMHNRKRSPRERVVWTFYAKVETNGPKNGINQGELQHVSSNVPRYGILRNDRKFTLYSIITVFTNSLISLISLPLSIVLL